MWRPSTRVRAESKMEEAGLPVMSDDTSGSSEYSRTPANGPCAGEFVEDGGERGERVGRAGRVRDDGVQFGVVRIRVDAVGEGDVGAVRRCADQNLPRTRVEVGAGGLGRGEPSGGLQRDIYA